MSDVIIKSLTDDRIRELTSDRVIITPADFNLKKSVISDDGESFTLHPEPKGIYDPRYFGSIYSKSCNCGRIKKVGMTCDSCGSMLMTEEMAFSRFARIDMGFYFCHRLKLNALESYIKSTYQVDFDYDESYPQLFIYTGGGDERLKIQWKHALLIAKWSWDSDGKKLIVSNKITDPTDCGLDSLVTSLKAAGDEKWVDFLNKLIIVTPARMRQVAIRIEGNQKIVKVPESSACYSALVTIQDDMTFHLSNYYAKGKSATTEDVLKLALKKAAACWVVISTEDKLTSLTASSKQNIARMSYKIRQENSGRSVITGDPTLKIDQVGIPVQLAYEALKSDFINHIRSELMIKKSDAILRYQDPDNQIKQMFREYAGTRKVLLNRAPTLHKYNILSFSITLTNDNSIHIPLAVTGAFNADFDGDTMSFFVIPQEIDEYVDNIMSPRNIKVFEKNDSFQFTPKHEMLAGLTLLTKTQKAKEGTKLIEVSSLETAEEMIMDSDLEVYEEILYKGRKTTYGREKVSEIIQAHLDHVLAPGEYITKRNIDEVYAIINKYTPETRVEMIRDLQNIALKWITEYGATTPTLKDISKAADDEFKPMAEAVLNDDSLDDKSKFVKTKELYDSRLAVVKERNKELATTLDESGRAKVFQLMELSVPQFLMTDNKEIVIPERPLVEGLNEREYVTHSYNNRALLVVKSISVPAGGWLTRQLVFLCQSMVINVESDPENPGILLPRYRCEGRVTTDGDRITETLNKDKKDLVRVRSVVQSRRGVISEDMFSDKYGFTVERNRVGISLASSFTEQLTQSLLGLKHGGAMATIPDDYKIKAKEECKVIEHNDTFYKIENRKGIVKTYPSSSYIRFTDPSKGKWYQANEVMVELVLPLPPTLNVEMVITLIGAGSVLNRNKMTRADVTIAMAYTLKGGKVSYDFKANNVKIGDEVYPLEDTAAYYFADGEIIPPLTKFRSGLTKPNMITPKNPTPEQLEKTYHVFRDQIYNIMGEDSVNEELMEVVFRGCFVNGEFKSVNSVITETSSVLASMSYGNASKSIQEVLREPQYINNDPMSNVLLNYFIRNAAHGDNFVD